MGSSQRSLKIEELQITTFNAFGIKKGKKMVQRLIGPLSMSSCKVLQEAGILTAAAILEASEREGSHNSNLTDQRDKRKRNISVE